MIDWRLAIVELVQVQQAIHEIDRDELWEWHLPAVAADDATLLDAERRLGFRLDPSYRHFLGLANGWRAFFQTIDLFGTVELCAEADRGTARAQLLDPLPPQLLKAVVGAAERLVVIAAARHDRDIFVVPISHGQMLSSVTWLAGEEIERFDTFEEFFAAMLAYNRRLHLKMRNQNARS